MNWKARTPDSVKCAVRALKKEIFEFSFNYPLYTVPESLGNDSLHYYLYSDALAWEALRLDPNGSFAPSVRAVIPKIQAAIKN